MLKVCEPGMQVRAGMYW